MSTSHVLSLIAAVPEAILSEADVARAGSVLQDAGVGPGEIAWLAEGEAADLALDTAVPAEILGALRDGFAGRRIDVNAVPVAHRRKRLIVADMDSTMIGQECIDELAAELGIGERIAAITERAMRGEIAFEPALRERVALLKGLAAGTVQTLLDNRITLMPGGTTLIGTMRKNGAYAALVSGGFTAFAGPIAERIGFDEFRANVLHVDGASFAGTVEEPILGRDAKKATLRELSDRLGLAADETMAVGDGANDLAMVEAAGLGVAYHAKPTLKEAAGAIIDHADLTGLLYLQGYRKAEFAA